MCKCHKRSFNVTSFEEGKKVIVKENLEIRTKCLPIKELKVYQAKNNSPSRNGSTDKGFTVKVLQKLTGNVFPLQHAFVTGKILGDFYCQLDNTSSIWIIAILITLQSALGY